ncbi:MAG: hypothetical protein IJC55_04035 [Clostridia bacterium]|nr:hypothetical protein [Clostridia bacterium]
MWGKKKLGAPRRAVREATLRQKAAAFLHAFCVTMFILLCVLCLLLMIAKADTATRAVGFADETPAFWAKFDGQDITIKYFGAQVHIPLQKITDAINTAKAFCYHLLPPELRALWEQMTAME